MSTEAKSQQTNEYANIPVPQSARLPWYKPAIIWFGFSVGFLSFFIGGQIESAVGMPNAIYAILLGNAFLVLYSGLIAVAAVKTGYSFPMMVKATFGEKGALIPILLMALLVNGWFAFQAWVVADIFHTAWGANPFFWGLLFGVLFFITTFAYKYMIWLRYVAVPAIVLLGAYLIFGIIIPAGGDAWSHVLDSPQPLSIGFGIALSVFIVSGTMTADIVRFSKKSSHAILVTCIAFFIGNSGSLILGALATAGAAKLDMYFGMIAIAGAVPLAIAAILSNWSTADSCLYNATMGYSNLSPKIRWKHAVIFGGILGAVVAATGVISNLIAWMNIIGILVPPIGGILIADYYLLRFGKGYDEKRGRPYNWFALFIALLATIISYIWGNVFPSFPNAVIGVLVAFSLYGYLGKFFVKNPELAPSTGTNEYIDKSGTI
jgi:cytosine permease